MFDILLLYDNSYEKVGETENHQKISSGNQEFIIGNSIYKPDIQKTTINMPLDGSKGNIKIDALIFVRERKLLEQEFKLI